MRALYIAACFSIGAAAAYFAGPILIHDDGAQQIFVTVYTVLAGFLVAVITVLGDPALLPSGSWRRAETHRDAIEARLIRHSWLFGLYLVTIGLIFVSTLLKNASPTVIPMWIKNYLAYGYFWLGTSAFLLSLGLPKMLMGVQRARVDAEIERRRQASGVPPEQES